MGVRALPTVLVRHGAFSVMPSAMASRSLLCLRHRRSARTIGCRLATLLTLAAAAASGCVPATGATGARSPVPGELQRLRAGAAVRIRLAPPRTVRLFARDARTVLPPGATDSSLERADPGDSVIGVQEVVGRVSARRGDTVVIAVTSVRQVPGAPQASGWKAGAVHAELALGAEDQLQVLSRDPFLLTVGVLTTVVATILLVGLFLAAGASS